MMVTFVSQCEKNALKKTRRVLDAFANRIGDNTWQTLITEDGLLTVKKMLRQTASKSTAVSCHWIRSRARSQFLWVVGNKDKFNTEGVVPVNKTEKKGLIKERFALNTEVVANLAAMAGFFHDVGKANKLFQAKLGVLENNKSISNDAEHSNGKKTYEPLRHEWVSLRMFQAYVGQQTDQQWLTSLVNINHQAIETLMQALPEYQDLQANNNIANPLEALPPIAKMVAWLIVSHHRLPQFPKSLESLHNLENIAQWQQVFEPCWNSPQASLENWPAYIIQANWQFPLGTPFNSAFWQTHISTMAKCALSCQRLLKDKWHGNLFTQHLARLSLMLADHAESSKKDIDNSNSDRNCLAYANTDKNENGEQYLKQKLDEHNINVGELAYKIACELPSLQSELQVLGNVKALEAPVPKTFKAEFGWQDKATKLANSLKGTVKEHGFFGISMASTGKGKTRANAKIMYALSEQGQCRFNVALGLRTLSIQTAKALRKDLFGESEKGQQLAQEKVALLVGSQAVRDLQQLTLMQEQSSETDKGSESKESLLKDEITLLSHKNLEVLAEFSWLAHDPKILTLLNAPVLVSTIDYLIPATEGVRGGRQIAPILRLLTSDLVLDEPDDFNSDDFPALCRLVNWAGMLGSKVLISTATITPTESKALFEAYQHGRLHYIQANGEQNTQNKVCCAWFDEHNQPVHALVDSVEMFQQKHRTFVNERAIKLAQASLNLRQGKLVNVTNTDKQPYSKAIATRVYQSTTELHLQHAVKLLDKSVSIGLVRMANINPLVQVAKHLMATSAPENTCIHYCVYHGQYPLLQRTSIEQMLDKALKRHNFTEWAGQSGICEQIKHSPEKNHLFVVLATSVAEVGRDHDYDWAVVEPSSQRSIIQLAGRVQRHRKKAPSVHNIHVLSKNYKGLNNKSDDSCFQKPGFERRYVSYASNDLNNLNINNELNDISAITRIVEPADFNFTDDIPPKFKKFSELEHIAQNICLYGSKSEKNYAAHWWQHDVSWSGEMQRLQPFRKSLANQDYSLTLTRENKPKWQCKVQGQYPIKYEPTTDIKPPKEPLILANNIKLWHKFNLAEQILQLSQQVDKSEQYTLTVYTHVSLREHNKNSVNHWLYEPALGIYKLLRKDDYLDDK